MLSKKSKVLLLACTFFTSCQNLRFDTQNYDLIPQSIPVKEQIVCLHGFLGSKIQMLPISKHLRQHGHYARVWGYKSRKKEIEDHARDLVEYLNQLAKYNPKTVISFVTHSFGAVVLKSALNHPDCPEVAKQGRAVLIAPPNRGCYIAHKYRNWPAMKVGLGSHSGREIAESNYGDFESLGQFPSAMDILVIAGKSKLNPIIHDDNDGLIKVEETTLSTEHKLVVVNSDHLSILIERDTYDASVQFFSHSLNILN
ncbi:MAG: alpha/beta hydrolase [Rhabdochlamydiaceae bacterium]|nr:alpha/beta hydrolase [Candidatus Amphrikana amoebophyrae]